MKTLPKAFVRRHANVPVEKLDLKGLNVAIVGGTGGNYLIITGMLCI